MLSKYVVYRSSYDLSGLCFWLLLVVFTQQSKTMSPNKVHKEKMVLQKDTTRIIRVKIKFMKPRKKKKRKRALLNVILERLKRQRGFPGRARKYSLFKDPPSVQHLNLWNEQASKSICTLTPCHSTSIFRTWIPAICQPSSPPSSPPLPLFLNRSLFGIAYEYAESSLGPKLHTLHTYCLILQTTGKRNETALTKQEF